MQKYGKAQRSSPLYAIDSRRQAQATLHITVPLLALPMRSPTASLGNGYLLAVLADNEKTSEATDKERRKAYPRPRLALPLTI